MPQNVLLHFPIVDLVCLQRSLREHTRRILKFIHQHNEYIKKCKVFTSDKESAPFPIFLFEVPNEFISSGDFSLSEDDIFRVVTESNAIVNDRTVRSDVVNKRGDSARVRSSELNSLYREIASDLQSRNREEDFGNLTTLSCPIRFPSEEKPIFLTVPGFETFESPPKNLSHNIKNSKKNNSEFVENEVQQFVVKKEKEGQINIKMEPNNHFEETEDEVMVIEVKKEKNIEVITIDDDEDDSIPQLESSSRQTSSVAKPSKTAFEVSEPLRIPPEDLTPPSLTPEVSEPPCLSPEIMEPILTPESSQPPLIFPEIDPPLWTFSGSSPVTSSEDAQPPVLTPEVRDPALPPEADTAVFNVSDESQAPLISSEVLTPMLMNPETSNSSSLPPEISPNTLITLDSESSHESATDSRQESISSMATSKRFIPPVVPPQGSTSYMTPSEQSQPSVSHSEKVKRTTITPKKTNDITKIKGWKRKHFVVEKPGTVEFHSLNKKDKVRKRVGTQKTKDKRLVQTEDGKDRKTVEKSAENAFVSDSLDKFLEGEADLNIDYEVPHLYAEVGITLTKDAVVSMPNVSDEELKNVVTKYCIPVNLKDDTDKIFESKRKEKRGVKRKLKQGFQSSKARKLEASKKNSSNDARRKEAAQTESNHTKATSQRSTSSQIEDSNGKGIDGDGQGPNKLLGLALYPGPDAPLPKAVQRHLDNIRSYQLTVDRNWANFAASALAVPKKLKHMRMILPVQYSAEKFSRLKESRVVSTNVNKDVTKSRRAIRKDASKLPSAEVTARLEAPKRIFRKQERINKKSVGQGTNVKKRKIVVNKANDPSPVWCMEHNRYNCHPCGLNNDTRGGRESQPTEGDFPSEFFVMSTPLRTNQDIASFLTQKLRNSTWKDIAVSNIDSLRTIVPNNLEFIKMSLVRDSFLTKYIYIWYLKSRSNVWNQSRAFLTFSKTSPIPNAIRYRADSQMFEEKLPKIIKDIMTLPERNADNEFAIMLCNEKVWELHGSLRYATRNPSPENFQSERLKREEVFTPTYPPELERISRAATKVIKEPSARWWVMDLTQKFSTIVSKLDSQVKTISKKCILKYLKMKFYGFLTLNVSSDRAIWVHMFPNILPYVLIGPYKLTEPHGIVLKQGLKVIPFLYHSNLHASPNFPLKNFIISVMAQVKEQQREIKGLWLCDRKQVDKTCYLEVFTSSKENIFSMLKYSIDVEHGYSLKSLINAQALKEVKREVSQAVPKVKVYLYFDLIDLGYITGNLFQDDTVMTRNPLNKQIVTVPSHAFGNWFICLLKEKVRFVPNSLKLKWYVTKHSEDLKERQPFDVRYLREPHMICEVGSSRVLKLIEMKVNERDSERVNNSETAAERKKKRKREEAIQLKRLDRILYGASSSKINRRRLLNKAEDEIEELENLCNQRCEISENLRSRRFELGERLIQLLDSFGVDDVDKILWFRTLNFFFLENENCSLQELLKNVLLRHKFGRLFLILNGDREMLDAENDGNARIRRKRVTKKRKTVTKTTKKKTSSRNLPCSVTQIPITIKSGNQRKKKLEASKAAKKQVKETPTTSSVATPAESSVDNSTTTDVFVINTFIFLITTPTGSDTQNDNTQTNSTSLNINPEPSTSANSRQMPKFDTILFLPITSDSQQTVTQQQSSDLNEQVPPPETTTTTQQQQQGSILRELLEAPIARPSNTEIETLSESMLAMPPSEPQELEEPLKSEVESLAQSLIVLPPLEQTRFVVSEPISLESTTTSSQIHIPNNSEDNENNESNEIMVFDPELGCFVTFGLNE